jgi:hypothetical protein
MLLKELCTPTGLINNRGIVVRAISSDLSASQTPRDGHHAHPAGRCRGVGGRERRDRPHAS